MRPEIVAALECPACRARLAVAGRSLRCAAGHSFDLARSGYVSFLVGRHPHVGDDASMVAARAAVLDAGHFDPLSRALAARAGGAGAGIVIELGAGTARHLSAVLEALPGAAGLALDVSADAARRAARAHPRASAVVADARRRLPVADGAAGLVLLAFAPRPGPELRRVLARDGLLLVATPLPGHLAALRAVVDLLAVDPDKEARLEAALSPGFARTTSDEVRWELALTRCECAALVAMGPSARHLARGDLEARVAALPEPVRVEGACRVDAWRPR